jgi:hypothetical protein
VDQLQAYSRNIDPLYYTTKFVDGLRDDIKTAVQYLILLAAWLCCRRSLEWPQQGNSEDLISYYKPQHKGPLPFRRPLEQAKQSPATDSQVKGSQKSQSVEDKMASLIAYRMAKELCKKCGEKCGRTHQCANLVQLHVLQEVWDLFQLEDTGTQEDSVSDQELMAISVVALTGQETAKTENQGLNSGYCVDADRLRQLSLH